MNKDTKGFKMFIGDTEKEVCAWDIRIEDGELLLEMTYLSSQMAGWERYTMHVVPLDKVEAAIEEAKK